MLAAWAGAGPQSKALLVVVESYDYPVESDDLEDMYRIPSNSDTLILPCRCRAGALLLGILPQAGLY